MLPFWWPWPCWNRRQMCLASRWKIHLELMIEELPLRKASWIAGAHTNEFLQNLGDLAS